MGWSTGRNALPTPRSPPQRCGRRARGMPRCCSPLPTMTAATYTVASMRPTLLLEAEVMTPRVMPIGLEELRPLYRVRPCPGGKQSSACCAGGGVAARTAATRTPAAPKPKATPRTMPAAGRPWSGRTDTASVLGTLMGRCDGTSAAQQCGAAPSSDQHDQTVNHRTRPTFLSSPYSAGRYG